MVSFATGSQSSRVETVWRGRLASVAATGKNVFFAHLQHGWCFKCLTNAAFYSEVIGYCVNQIKNLMFDESPNVSRSLNKLVDAGYVMKQRSEKDLRIVHIHITEEGHQIHLNADAALLSMDGDMTLSDQEAEQLYKLLAKL